MTIIERIKGYVNQVAPITISWDETRILRFLKEQATAGNQDAFDLLYLALQNKICAVFQTEATNSSDKESKERLIKLAGMVGDFPEDVREALKSDIKNGLWTAGMLKEVSEKEASEDKNDADEEIPF